MPAVSVVIPTYNRAKFLPAAIRSVQAQSFSDWELVIVDDGSTDESFEVVGHFARSDARLRLLRNERRRGPAGARNSGIIAAQGDAIALLDSDDTWEPTILAKLMAAMAGDARSVLAGSDIRMKSTRDPDLTMKGFVLGTMLPWWSTYPPALAVLPCEAIARDFSVFTQSSLAISSTIAGFLWIHSSSTMVRRSAVMEAGLFDERLQRTEDIELWLKLSQAGTFVYIDEVLATYDIEGRDLGTGTRYEGQDPSRRHTAYSEAVFHLSLVDRIARSYPLTPAQKTLVRHRRAAHHGRCLRLALEAGDLAGVRHIPFMLGSTVERAMLLRWLKDRYGARKT